MGQLGSDASQELKKFRTVYIHGRVNFQKNIEILSSCSVGIYPRKHDHKRSILKIFSYIGAGLPIVTFDLIDTEVVKLNSLGYTEAINEENNTSSKFFSFMLTAKNTQDITALLKHLTATKKDTYDFDLKLISYDGNNTSYLSELKAVLK